MSFKRIFQKKAIADIQAESRSGVLKRTLGPWNLVSLGIGCIIGTGIFVLTGQEAAIHAGPAIVISFIFAGIASAFAALCYAELSSVLPVSGSAYTYAYASLGEVFAWIMGWLLILEYGAASATVAVGWSGYVVSFLNDIGLIIPVQYTRPLGAVITTLNGDELHGVFNLPAFLGVLAVTSLLILGIKESATVNNVIVFVKVAVILAFIGIGVFYIDTANWKPFIPPEFGYKGVLTAAGVIFFAYIGFEAVSTASQEAKNPQRDVPIGILGALGVCTLLYILVALVLTGIIPYKYLNVPDPIAVAADHIGLRWFAYAVKVGAIMGLSSVMLVLVYGQTRIFFSMSRDGLLPKLFSVVHKKYQTPHWNTIVVGFIVATAAGLVPLHDLSQVVSVGTLLAFSIICFTVIYMRVKNSEIERPFSVPFYPITPILGIASCLYLASALSETLWNLKYYFVVGLVIYFSYSQFRSNITKASKK